jgi:acyl-coenzyme A synthetase/AMP-(fatty) acid ligase
VILDASRKDFFTLKVDETRSSKSAVIGLTEIENRLNELDYVAQSVTLVNRATEDDRTIASFVVLEPRNAKTPQQIENLLRSSLTKQMIPQILILDDLPYLPSGKVDRQKLLHSQEIFEIHKIAIRKEVNVQRVE